MRIGRDALRGDILEEVLAYLIRNTGYKLLVDPVHKAVSVTELAIEKGASYLLMPVSSRKQLNELSDDMATKIAILYYGDLKEALLKALVE